MNSGINSLHKILKDETRKKVILLLDQRGSLTYTGLKEELGIVSTGRLNYHLKILSELIMKREDGEYTLTEKGRLASRLLQEFADKQSNYPVEKEYTAKWFYYLASILGMIFVIGYLISYLSGIINLSQLVLSFVIFFSTVTFFLVVLISRKFRNKWSPQRQIIAKEISMIAFWALAGLAILFIGGAFLLFGVQTLIQSFGVSFVLFPFAWWGIISFIFGPIIGGFIGYLAFKRSKYSKINYYDTFS
jgi:DNA-binding HxlR family transcriptional regulator